MATPEQQAAGLARRSERYGARVQWYGRQVRDNVRMTAARRIQLVGQLLRDKVVINLSTPVRKYKGPRSKRIQVDPASRSKPGGFPHAETTRLMKDIFYEMEPKAAGGTVAAAAIVGTTLDYGLILETKRDRSFLVRTLNEEASALGAVLNTGGRA